MPKSAEVKAMFRRVAPRYDFLNHALSAGSDFWWRHVLTQKIQQQKPRDLLDLATGSGDVLRGLSRAGAFTQHGIGADFCLPMLQTAQAKGLSILAVADALRLPFKDESFDAVTIAFGLRNLENRALGLREMARVLRPGGQLYLLEFSRPWLILQAAYFFYLHHFLPPLAAVLGASKEDYIYLGDSIRAFPDAETLTALLRGNGFSRVDYWRLTGGLVALHRAGKSPEARAA